MGTTTIKRFENRSSNPIALFDLENTSTRGHGVTVPPGSSITVDMAIPWSATADPFNSNHRLEIRVNGVTRFWIWQAANNDGDYIRFSTDGQWHDMGDHVHGYAGTANNIFDAVVGLFTNADDPLARLVLGERTIVVLDSHFECIPISPKPLQLLFTTIKQIQNKTTGTVKFLNLTYQGSGNYQLRGRDLGNNLLFDSGSVQFGATNGAGVEQQVVEIGRAHV